ncbi:TPA: pyruvate ferredoxin oxidoreductase [bacterium]|nr:pyruvate ferredoxin oxidoreductase [bacterium]
MEKLTLKELSRKKEGFSSGHRSCAGCSEPIAVRQIFLAIDKPIVVGSTTGCLEVTTTIFPYTAWKVSFVHSAFENVAATISGVVAGYNALKKKGEINEDIVFIAFGGDGGTYDIGIQSLSGSLERGDRFLYVCINNEAYMNTGVQRSSATPKAAHTTTEPAGKVSPGKQQERKNLTEIVSAHNIPYVAQAVVGNWLDLMKKVQKAVSVDGPSFINILSPCPLGWGFPNDQTIEMGKLAVETCFWPLYEVEDGKYRITYKPKEKKPVFEFIKHQGRFSHILDKEEIISFTQKNIDGFWDGLVKKSSC